jgi:hypothetical protein
VSVGPWESIRQAAGEAKTDTAKRKARPPKAKQLHTTPAPGVRPKPTGKQVQVANAVTIPVRSNGGLDLRHARKDIPNGARYLDLARLFLGNYIRWPDPESLDIAALYVAATHFVDDDGDPLFNAWPRFFLIGRKGSGKTRAMKVMRGLTREPTIVAWRYTFPGVRDQLHNHKVPVLDELHHAIGGLRGTKNEALLSVILGSYSAEGGSLDGIGNANERQAFGPMILGAQPQIITQTNDGLTDLFERSFMVTMEKAYENLPEIDDQFAILGENFNNLLDVWAAYERPIPTNLNKKPKLWPIHSLPDELTDRAAEISTPLLAVADRAVDPDVVEQNGHDIRWALIAREAVVKVLKGHGNNPSTIVGDIESKLGAMGLDLGQVRQPKGTIKM